MGSQSEKLCQILNKNSRVQFCKLNIIYDHPFTLDTLFEQPHKTNNASALWLDELVQNHQFTGKSLYPFCRFIYFIRDAKRSLFEIVKQERQSSHMCRYYCYRLRRIFEMARKTPKATFLTWDDLVKGKTKKLEEFLRLKEPLSFSPEEFTFKNYNQLLSSNQIEEMEQVYEKYHSKFRTMFGST